MPRSIKIYALCTGKSIGAMRAKIRRHRPRSPIVEAGGKKHLPEIAVSRGQEGGGESGHMCGIVRMPIKTASDDGPVLGHGAYAFCLGKAPQAAAAQGSQKAPHDIPCAALGGTAAALPRGHGKRRMIGVPGAIRAPGNAIVYGPRFEFAGSEGCGGLPRGGFAVTRRRCATARPHYGEMPERASMFEPVPCAFRADGICSEASGLVLLLRINRHSGFSMHADVPLGLWVRPAKKYALPALEADA